MTLSGTTTFGRDAIDATLARRGLSVPLHVELDGVLQREPDNRADPHAVAVLIDGERVAYLPSHVAQRLDLPSGASQRVRIQLFAKEQDGRTRAVGWAWLGTDEPKWQFGLGNWPAITRDETRAAQHSARRDLVTEGMRGGGDRANRMRAGMVDGVHYLELVEPIKQLKREGRHEEALELCFVAITGAEGEHASSGLIPPPWYTEQAAIILRRLKRLEEEAEVLRRYLALLPTDQRSTSRIAERLSKVEARP
ncbi:MAG: hypothetical protein HGA44_13510 [Cellulomonadaceae bacterium]|nr:hypothetical protein [Cellulomonadaceae bacterium]